MQQWNQDPKPFVWIKTADEILASLAKYWSPVVTVYAVRPLLIAASREVSNCTSSRLEAVDTTLEGA